MQREVLAKRDLPSGAMSQDAQIILCHLPDNSLTPYATWQCNISDGGYYWGHYFKTLSEASADFDKR